MVQANNLRYDQIIQMWQNQIHVYKWDETLNLISDLIRLDFVLSDSLSSHDFSEGYRTITAFTDLTTHLL